MRFKVHGNKKDVVGIVVQNDDAIVIKAGAPVFLKIDGADDGMDVVSSNNLGAAAEQGFAGIATKDIAVGSYDEPQVFGFFDYARVAVGSRAASSDVWASYPAGALRDMLAVMTGTGHAAGSTQADQCFTRLGAGSAISVSGLWPVILGETYASSTTRASSLGGSSTVSVTLKKVFVRAM